MASELCRLAEFATKYVRRVSWRPRAKLEFWIYLDHPGNIYSIFATFAYSIIFSS